MFSPARASWQSSPSGYIHEIHKCTCRPTEKICTEKLSHWHRKIGSSILKTEESDISLEQIYNAVKLTQYIPGNTFQISVTCTGKKLTGLNRPVRTGLYGPVKIRARHWFSSRNGPIVTYLL